jgi:tRNA acetyltransferase TAN1
MPKESRGKQGYSSNTFALNPNTTGILISCNRSREARCISEMKDMMGILSDGDIDSNATGENVDVCIEDALEKELRELRKGKGRMEQVQLGDVKCMVFVRMPDPISFIDKLFTTLPTLSFYPKFCQRLLPMQMVCYANFTELMQCMKEYLKEFVDDDTNASYAIVFESRLNSSLDRQTVTHAIADMVGRRWRVDLKHPDKVILIQVLKVQYWSFNVRVYVE